MKILKEFKEFAMRGNVLDLAIGVVIGAAFGKIVSSLVEHVITPFLGLLVAGVKFDHLKIVIKPGRGDEPPVAVGYGQFLESVIDFVIVAFAIFLLVKLINHFRRKEEAKTPPTPPRDVVVLEEIRDLLKAQNDSRRTSSTDFKS